VTATTLEYGVEHPGSALLLPCLEFDSVGMRNCGSPCTSVPDRMAKVGSVDIGLVV
jgi:hypothetical protein